MFQNKYRIIIAEVNKTDWAKDLDEFKHSLLITPEWVGSMSNENTIPLYLNFIHEEKIIGKISGFICDCGKLNGKQLYFYASPALKEYDQDMFDAYHAALFNYAKNKGYSRIILGSYDQQHQLKTNASNFFTTTRFEYIIDLTEPVKFDRCFRRNLKKAENNNVEFKQNNSQEILNRLFELLNITKEHRVSKYGSDYNPLFLRNMSYESLSRLIGNGIANLYYADCGEEINIVCYNIEKNNRVYSLLLGSNDKSYELRLPSYLTYNMIMHSQNRGFVYYNPGGGTGDAGNDGLERFKQSMGAKKTYFYGATTNFIKFPQKLLNPLMNMGRMMPRKNPIVKLIKKII